MAEPNTGDKRKSPSTLPEIAEEKRKRLANLDNSIIRRRDETLSALIDGKHADVTIKCGDKEIKACKAILCAGCKFFDACFAVGGFKESASNVVHMDDDEPNALEALIVYLHTFSLDHIKNWKFSSAASEEKNSTTLPAGYAPFLVEVLRLADKYDQSLLGEAILNLFDGAKEDSEMNSYYKAFPEDVLEVLSIAEDLPNKDWAKQVMGDAVLCILHDDLLQSTSDERGDELGRRLEVLFRDRPQTANYLLRGHTVYIRALKRLWLESKEVGPS